MRALGLLLIVTLLSLAMMSCGQKGPLYMPEDIQEAPEQKLNEDTK